MLSILILSLLLFSNLPVSGLNFPVEEEWLGIYSGNTRVGYSHILVKDGEVYEETRLKMTVLGTTQDVVLKTSYTLSGYAIEKFNFSMTAGSVDLGAVGKRENGQLNIEVVSLSGKQKLLFPLDEGVLASPLIFRWIVAQQPAVGRSYEVIIFDPTSVLTGVSPEDLKAKIAIEARENVKIPLGSFSTYRVRVSFMGSSILSWITDKGEVIREEVSPPGFVYVKETADSIREQALSGVDIIEKTAISSNVSLGDPKRLKSLIVSVDGLDSTEGLDLQDGRRQFFKGDLIEVRVEDLSSVKPYYLPYSGMEYRSYIEPEPFIQSDNPEIREVVRGILQEEKNPIVAVGKISKWVYEHVDKVPTVSLPNALDVLKTKRGDCNEHAILFAALSRAAGIPTKVVQGVVLLNDRFYYHAWNEVFVGEWVAVDSTLGQFPADASHIKFVEGGLKKSANLMKLIGRIKLEVRGAS
jgi:hypothetical protein